MAKKNVGTSAFTVQDDAGVEHHTTVPEHREALRKGVDVPNSEVAEVVFGPGAFGSPDPRTLSHVLLSDGANQVDAPHAPDLAHDFGGGRNQNSVSEDDLNDMKKDDLKALADANGIEVNESDTKAEMIEKIKAGPQESDTSDDDAGSNVDDSNDDTNS